MVNSDDSAPHLIFLCCPAIAYWLELMVPWGERHKRCNLSANTWDLVFWALGLRIKRFLTTRWKLEGAEWANLRAQAAKTWAGGVPIILQASTPVCRLLVKRILWVSTFFLLISKWSFGSILGTFILNLAWGGMALDLDLPHVSVSLKNEFNTK